VQDVMKLLRSDFEKEVGPYKLRKSSLLYESWVEHAGGIIKGSHAAAKLSSAAATAAAADGEEEAEESEEDDKVMSKGSHSALPPTPFSTQCPLTAST
jgi:hypothetical protein